MTQREATNTPSATVVSIDPWDPTAFLLSKHCCVLGVGAGRLTLSDSGLPCMQIAPILLRPCL